MPVEVAHQNYNAKGPEGASEIVLAGLSKRVYQTALGIEVEVSPLQANGSKRMPIKAIGDNRTACLRKCSKRLESDRY